MVLFSTFISKSVPTLPQPPPRPQPPHRPSNLSADMGVRGGGPQRKSMVPLSILELQSVEKSKSAVTKPGLLPRTVLTVQSRRKGRRWGTTWVQTLGLLTI